MPVVHRRWLAAITVALIMCPLSAHAQVAASSSGGDPVPTQGRLAAPRAVDVRTLPADRTRQALHAAPRISPRVSSSPTSGVDVRAPAGRGQGGAAPAMSGGQEEILAAFPGADQAGLVARLGPDQAVAPPDPQVAVGPDRIAEQVNSAMLVFDKSGTPLQIADLNSFYAAPAGYMFTDPKIAYDVGRQRFFASGLLLNPSNSNSRVVLSVSNGTDPGAGWLVYVVASNLTGIVDDQPKLAVTADKVVLSWSDFQSSTTFIGQETWVVEKADVVAGAPSARTSFFPKDPNRFGLMLAPRPATFTAAIAAYNHSSTSPNFVGVVVISGTPAQGNVAIGEADVPFPGTSRPPPAQQPGGGAFQTNDDRFLAAVWQNNQLWLAGNTGCIPTGDTAVRVCPRVVEVNTTTTFFLAQNFNIGISGQSLAFPAITLDASGALVCVFTASSLSNDPTVVTTTLAAGGSALSPLLAIQRGAGTYGDSFGNRWGDYSGAAPDPANPADIWLVGEFTPSAGLTSNWGTGIGRVTMAQPTVSAVSPSSGPASQSSTVVVHGTDFVLGGTTVQFGSSAAPQVTVQSPETLTAVTPPLGAGAVDVTVTTADGTSVVSSQDLFTFVTVPPPTQPPPASREVTIARRSDGNTDLFLRGGDGSAWHAAADIHGNPFGGWESLSGGMVGAPVGTWNNGELDVFAIGNDYQPWEKRYITGQGWTSWVPIGGRTVATSSEEVTAARRVDGSIDLFIRGGDSGAWHLVTDSHGSPVSGYESLGGGLAGDPVAVWSNGALYVYAVGSDQSVYTKSYTTGWSGWTKVAGNAARATSAHVTVADRGNGLLDLLVLGTDNQIWHSATDSAGNPVGWEAIGGYLLGTAWGSWQASQFNVVGVGSDHRVYGQEYSAGWHGWVLLPGGGLSA